MEKKREGEKGNKSIRGAKQEEDEWTLNQIHPRAQSVTAWRATVHSSAKQAFKGNHFRFSFL